MLKIHLYFVVWLESFKFLVSFPSKLDIKNNQIEKNVKLFLLNSSSESAFPCNFNLSTNRKRGQPGPSKHPLIRKRLTSKGETFPFLSRSLLANFSISGNSEWID